VTDVAGPGAVTKVQRGDEAVTVTVSLPVHLPGVSLISDATLVESAQARCEPARGCS
jgi:hypothetical protein